MKPVIYASDRYKRFFAKSVNNIHNMRSLRIRAINNATIVIEPDTQRFGVFDATGTIIEESLQLRNKIVQQPPIFTSDADVLNIEAVYLGTLEDHFGHFLLEHTNRLYPVLYPKYKNLKYIILNNRNLQKIPDFVFEFLAALGIKKTDICLINTNTKVKCLYVPSVAFEIPNKYSLEFSKTFDATTIGIHPKACFDKVYVSREKLLGRATFGESLIQKIFKENGFIVIHPEQLSLSKQIEYMSHCKCLAGVAGSALHLSLFMPSGGSVIQIKRNKLLADNSDTQYLLCKIKNCNFILVDCAKEFLPTHHWSEFPQIIGPTKYLEQFLYDYKFTYNKQDLICNDNTRQKYRHAFRAKGGFVRYQIKRMLVYAMPRIMPTEQIKNSVRRWLNKHL